MLNAISSWAEPWLPQDGFGCPGGRAFVAGVSNDYLGYFPTAVDYRRASYVACASLYGPEAGARLTEAAAGLLRAVSADVR